MQEPKKEIAEIPESFFEYTAHFQMPMFEAWRSQNQILESLYPLLKSLDVGLGDITWNKETNSYKDIQLTFNIHKLNAAVKVGIETASLIAANPDWSEAPALVNFFATVLDMIKTVGRAEISSQEIGLAMHVKPGKTPFKVLLSRIVNVDSLGSAQMYGVSVYDENSSFVIDKSLRYDDSIFIRMHRRFLPAVTFSEIASALYADESRVLSIVGLQELLP